MLIANKLLKKPRFWQDIIIFLIRHVKVSQCLTALYILLGSYIKQNLLPTQHLQHLSFVQVQMQKKSQKQSVFRSLNKLKQKNQAVLSKKKVYIRKTHLCSLIKVKYGEPLRLNFDVLYSMTRIIFQTSPSAIFFDFGIGINTKPSADVLLKSWTRPENFF